MSPARCLGFLAARYYACVLDNAADALKDAPLNSAHISDTGLTLFHDVSGLKLFQRVSCWQLLDTVPPSVQVGSFEVSEAKWDAFCHAVCHVVTLRFHEIS